MKLSRWGWILGTLLLAGSMGCASPYHADRGAMFGGVAGAGVGALVGEAVGNPLAGAAIGAGVGMLSGAVVGESLDQIEARNRAEIEARLGRPLPAGAVTTFDVLAMTQAGVDDEIIINHVRRHGMATPLQTGDLISLKSSGVSPSVVQAMQLTSAPQRPAPATVVQAPPPPVVVHEYHYDPFPPPPPPYFYYHHRHPRYRPPRASWGIEISGR